MQEAERRLRKAVAADPNCWRAWFLLARIQIDSGLRLAGDYRPRYWRRSRSAGPAWAADATAFAGRVAGGLAAGVGGCRPPQPVEPVGFRVPTRMVNWAEIGKLSTEAATCLDEAVMVAPHEPAVRFARCCQRKLEAEVLIHDGWSRPAPSIHLPIPTTSPTFAGRRHPETDSPEVISVATWFEITAATRRLEHDRRRAISAGRPTASSAIASNNWRRSPRRPMGRKGRPGRVVGGPFVPQDRSIVPGRRPNPIRGHGGPRQPAGMGGLSRVTGRQGPTVGVRCRRSQRASTGSIRPTFTSASPTPRPTLATWAEPCEWSLEQRRRRPTSPPVSPRRRYECGSMVSRRCHTGQRFARCRGSNVPEPQPGIGQNKSTANSYVPAPTDWRQCGIRPDAAGGFGPP